MPQTAKASVLDTLLCRAASATDEIHATVDAQLAAVRRAIAAQRNMLKDLSKAHSPEVDRLLLQLNDSRLAQYPAIALHVETARKWAQQARGLLTGTAIALQAAEDGLDKVNAEDPAAGRQIEKIKAEVEATNPIAESLEAFLGWAREAVAQIARQADGLTPRPAPRGAPSPVEPILPGGVVSPIPNLEG